MSRRSWCTSDTRRTSISFLTSCILVQLVLSGLPGATGHLGPVGEAGSPDVTGPSGHCDAIGSPGPVGLTAPSGPALLIQLVPLDLFNGETGPTGPIGATGPPRPNDTGSPGPVGETGLPGATGKIGPPDL